MHYKCRICELVKIIVIGLVIMIVLSTGISAKAISAKSKLIVENLPSNTLTIRKGEVFKLKFNVATNRIMFSSDNNRIVSVSPRGEIRGKRKGQTYVNLVFKHDSSINTKIKVTVGLPVAEIKLNKKNIVMNVGETEILETLVLEKEASNRKVIYSSTDYTIVRINSNGKMHAISAGTAEIIATAADGSGKQASCIVTVVKNVLEESRKIYVNNACELKEAIDSIATSPYNNKANEFNQYDLYLNAGHYDLYAVLDKEMCSNPDVLFHRGIEIPDYVNLHGIGNVVLECTIPESDNSKAHNMSYIVSTLNIYGNNKFENLTIIGKNTKYCVHDDSAELFSNAKVEFYNCKFIHQGLESDSYWNAPYCYGAGYDAGRVGIFKNCTFKHSSYGLFYVHTSPAYNMSSPCYVYINNCKFNTPDGVCLTFQVPWETKQGVTGVLNISNSYFAQQNTLRFFGVLPITVFGCGNTPIEIINENNSYIHIGQ